jgi:hypothetical protein
MPYFLKQLLQQAEAQGSKSTALSPIGWLFGIAVSGLLGGIYAGAPTAVTVLLSTCVGGAALLYGGAYCYFMLTNVDALRSEKFTITKLAIEHSIKGDNLTGLIDGDDLPKILPPRNENRGARWLTILSPLMRFLNRKVTKLRMPLKSTDTGTGLIMFGS